jgi:hypothetical protein
LGSLGIVSVYRSSLLCHAYRLRRGLVKYATCIAVLMVTAGVFLSCLPRGGRRHRFVETELEPYVAVAICAGVALGFALVLPAYLDQ